MGNKKNTLAYIIAFLLFASGIGYLCLAGFSENSVYFLNVSEARAVEPGDLRKARLFGLVDQANLRQKANSVSFNLADKDDPAISIPVVYQGLIPDTFKAGAEVIVEGGLNGEGQFRAKTLMTKCPSKYQKENRKKI